MCCVIYLNGDGVGRGQYMSLSFAMMKGDYDHILSWPFQKRITMSLMHQGGGQDHSYAFYTDAQRPLQEMDVISGCKMFAGHSDIENHPLTYLVENTIFLKIVVTNIPSAAFHGIVMR